jgi:KUP system potassium uptake protein
LTTLGIFGASLFLADSMITPAISVLSAVERLRVVRPELEPLVIPITVVIIVALFAVQRVGTARVGRSFGPVMALWFISIGLAGAMGIAAEPGVLRALSPMYAISFLAAQSASAFFALAAVVLAITGRGSYLC